MHVEYLLLTTAGYSQPTFRRALSSRSEFSLRAPSFFPFRVQPSGALFLLVQSSAFRRPLSSRSEFSLQAPSFFSFRVQPSGALFALNLGSISLSKPDEPGKEIRRKDKPVLAPLIESSRDRNYINIAQSISRPVAYEPKSLSKGDSNPASRSFQSSSRETGLL